MRVLYGIQGTGNGHLARARALVPALKAAGLDIDYLFTGRRREDYFNMELFGDFACYPGLSLVTERGRLDHWRTATQNDFTGFWRDMRHLDTRQYDLVLSDFEPLTAWSAKLAGVRSVGISHQCAFTYDVPRVQGFAASRLLMQSFAPVATRVGLHWHHFQQPVLPPLIEPLAAADVQGDKILVYMGFETVPDIVEFLRPFTDFRFLVYARVEAPIEMDHILVKPLSHTAFHHDLADCFGVISNAGFELASECLALGKKLLVKPLLGQFEQLSNALALQALRRGTTMQSLDQRVLEKWLRLPGHPRIDYPDVPAALARWIAEGCGQTLPELAEGLWTDCELPFNFDKRSSRALQPGIIGL